ncbi:dTMP kinase [Pseudomaricurvus sp. HS19]|uniref:dTMP kinase n=1 Tax=Pseudomaricurvus sp. HS19 TaxID=2692626 RepID=UPI00136FA0ED|nr:dTMP kinase [Pseudomaricurvus sp. HS19]
MPQKGKFITLEGTEGVGKSTNLEFIRHWLQSQGIPLVVTREPGGTPLAEEVRELLLSPRQERVDHKAELLLVFAARAQHLAQVIRPALERGDWVLCDRFTDATFAYQGSGRGLPLSMITELETMVQEGLQPDLTLLLDIDVETGLARASARGDMDRFESEAVEFFQRVRGGYRARMEASPQRFALIDAGQELPAVQADIEQVLQRLVATVAS